MQNNLQKIFWSGNEPPLHPHRQKTGNGFFGDLKLPPPPLLEILRKFFFLLGVHFPKPLRC